MDMRTQIAKNGSALHPLKTWSEPFRAIINGTKRFEYRKNDRGFKVGDTLKLVEIDPKYKNMTGWCCYVDVTYITEGCFGVPDGYCVMSLSEPVTTDGTCVIIPVSEDED